MGAPSREALRAGLPDYLGPPLSEYVLEFVARKRVNGKRERWTEWFFAFEHAVRAETRYRAELRGRVRVTLYGDEIHAKRTRFGMDRARERGVHIGRPRKLLNAGRARGVLAGWTAVHGRMGGLAAASGVLGVSVSTLRRAEKGWRR